MNDAVSEEPYCQFGKRFLDGFSWLAPLTNNRFGDALNIEFVHEQLFFVQGDRVLDNVGYSEKGTRFNEAQFGKPIRSLDDLRQNGYWLVGRRFHPDAAREALAKQDDGHYYSFFSNQCQDWADRLKRRIERVEKTRGLEPLASVREAESGSGFWRERAPTVPASLFLGMVAILLGIGACLAPILAAQKSVIVLALFFIASGAADVVYALHGHAWSQILQTILFAMLNLLGGIALFLDTSVAATWAGSLFGYVLAVNGVSRMVVGLRSRPLKTWLVSLLAGFGLLIGAVLLLTRTVGERDAIFGLIVGVNLILGGASTIWLRWAASRLTADDSRPKEGSVNNP
jgi:uncharacterized membrane protein HdeD (DUF308 family)